MQLEGFLNNANSNHGKAGVALSTAGIALKQTANGLRSFGQFTTAYHARLANAAAIGKIASKLGVIGLGVNAVSISVKVQNCTLKPSDVAGFAVGLGLTVAALANPVGGGGGDTCRCGYCLHGTG
ncbi:hypothetical protein Slin_5274 [Spirosoma linguale DSM 74]|uniref:Uncharacterized protein n=2 Tax=Spirosoma TaxID=107 RepID=D2QE28_SPILD|nr:hypothetical protein Slin_5274 [Spirosoma linguale DSM 74]